jgi:CopG family transcriptional regulator/antitoxin EndoAI
LFGWQTRLEIQFQANIKEQLKQGAIKRAERDLGLVKEWFNLEEEAC